MQPFLILLSNVVSWTAIPLDVQLIGICFPRRVPLSFSLNRYLVGERDHSGINRDQKIGRLQLRGLQATYLLKADKIAITLRLVTLTKPYVKKFPFPVDDMKRYERVVQQGLSLGAYEGDHLVGIAIAERETGIGAYGCGSWAWKRHTEGAG
jgi:hypothetical protein